MDTNTVTASNSHGILAEEITRLRTIAKAQHGILVEEITRLRTLAKAQNDIISRVLDFWLGGDMPAGWAEEMLKLFGQFQESNGRNPWLSKRASKASPADEVLI